MNEDAQQRLLDRIAAEAKRIEEDALYNHVGHNEEARDAESWHFRLGIPTVILSAAAGVSSFSSAGASAPNAVWVSILAGSLSFGVAALAGVNTLLDPKGRSASHLRAAAGFAQLRDDARYFHQIDCVKERALSELENVLQELRKRFAKLNDETPIISRKAMARAVSKIENGDYVYAVDKSPSK